MKTTAPHGMVFLAVFSVFVSSAVLSQPKNKLATVTSGNKSLIIPPAQETPIQEAPTIKAMGDGPYCPLSNTNILTSVSITDPLKAGISNVYIQISDGYVENQDLLMLNNAAAHPNINSSWNAIEGKLTLEGNTANPIPVAEFESALKDVQFKNSSPSVSGSRTFSISLGKANYLPRNGHYYLYVAERDIYWSAAKTKAEQSRYFGLKGYLATITALDEAILAGEQVPGTGWIGASDEETEGTWKWVTGPEEGTIFWYGLSNGYSPNFAYWNDGEPNDAYNEDYAHITSPGVGKKGSWNDLRVQGGTARGPGPYVPQGYVVEFGGMPGDPILNISSSTKLNVARLESVTDASRCGEGSIELKASANFGTISWYDAPMGGSLLGTGTEYNSPILNTTTSFYAEVCPNKRMEAVARIIPLPTVLSTNSPLFRCGPGIFTLEASPSFGTINWYLDPLGAPLATSDRFTTPIISQNSIYYAEAVYMGCHSQTKVPLQLTITPKSEPREENLTSCTITNLVLDADLPNLNYLWNTGETSKTITVQKEGIYSVKISGQPEQNCNSSKTITVSSFKPPKITNIKLIKNSAEIELASYEKYYEFSLDQINYQKSNQFTELGAGKYIAYVRDNHKCNTISEPFTILLIPSFFTPNNDGINDLWGINGLNTYPNAAIKIFDRYGKLVYALDANHPYWDGTYNQKPLPETDYWYVIYLDDNSPIQKGHFSLER